MLRDLAGGDEVGRRDAERAQLERDLGVVGHAPAHERDAPATAPRQIGHALDAGDRGGEARDHDLAARSCKDLLEGGEEVVLGAGASPLFDVRRVGEQREHAAVAPRGEGLEVGALGLGRARVDLEVAAQEHDARGRLHREGQAVDDAVGHADGMDAERACLDGLARREQPEVGARRALLQPAAHEAEGEPAAVHGSGRGLQREGEASDVVLVAVGEDDRPEAVAALGQVLEVGHDRVDARHLRAREHQARVDQEEMVLPLHDERVQAEFPQAAEGHQAQHGAVSGIDHAGIARLRARLSRANSPTDSVSARRDPSMLSNLKFSLRLA